MLALLVVLSLGLMAFPTTAFAAETVEDPYEAYLRLGKPKPGVDQVVGGLQIWNDAETLFVQFETDEPFCISALHLQVANDLSDVPEMGGMVLPGSAINEDYDDCLSVRGPFEFNLIENGWNAGSNLVIAAHADIGELDCQEECVTVEEKYYPPSRVTASSQGKTYNDLVIKELYPDNRWNPEWVIDPDLDPEDLDLTSLDDFFSLGLFLQAPKVPEKYGGWITVEFDHPVPNGEGYDIWIIEETWGSYPLEVAKVKASTDNENWVDLGWVDNFVDNDPDCQQLPIENPEDNFWTVSCIEPDGSGLENVHYLRLTDYFCAVGEGIDDPENPCSIKPRVDTPEDIWDGYDVNSILSLQDYVECTEVCEDCYLGRAWAGNKIGSGAAWSRWVRYLVTGEGAVQDNGILTVLDIPEEIVVSATNLNDGAARQQILRGR